MAQVLYQKSSIDLCNGTEHWFAFVSSGNRFRESIPDYQIAGPISSDLSNRACLARLEPLIPNSLS
jgi:hypothetical protein